MSVRTKDVNKANAVEALRRAKYKFPGRQKILVSDNFGFTRYTRAEYEALRVANKLIPDGAGVKVVNGRGPLKLPKIKAKK